MRKTLDDTSDPHTHSLTSDTQGEEGGEEEVVTAEISTLRDQVLGYVCLGLVKRKERRCIHIRFAPFPKAENGEPDAELNASMTWVLCH